jgi:hypothetical protein
LVALAGGALVLGSQSTTFVLTNLNGISSSNSYFQTNGALALIGTALVLLGVPGIVQARGLWSGKGWAWTLSLILYGLDIVANLVLILLGSPVQIIPTVIAAVAIWYLATPQVKSYFGEGANIAGPVL